MPLTRITLLDDSGGRTAVTLAEVPVFSPGTRITTSSSAGVESAPLDVHIFRGRLKSRPGGGVLVISSRDGLRGVLLLGSERRPLLPVQEAGEAGMTFRLGTPEKQGSPDATPFHCAIMEEAPPFPPRVPTVPGARTATKEGVRLVCNLAVDCNYDFYAQRMGGSVSAAEAYVGEVVATMSLIYERDLNVAVRISYLNVWTTAADPYDKSLTSDQLIQFQNWWNANRAGVPRSAAILVSGRQFTDGNGTASLGTLCSSTLAYAVCALDGTASLPSNATMRDLRVISHELGHIFGSPHTQSCFWQSFGFVPPGALIDSCYAAEGSCYSGPTGIVPSGGGTIMSYCAAIGGAVRLDFHPVCRAYMRSVAEGSCLAADSIQPPENVSVRWAASGVTLAWSASTAPLVTGYEIRRSPTMIDLNPESRGTTGGTRFDDVAMPGTYFYRVRAITANGLSGDGPEVKAVAGTTDHPPVVTASATATTKQGTPLLLGAAAGDPDGDAVASLGADLGALPPGNDAVFTVNATNTLGTLSWTPSQSDSGNYPVRFIATNAASDTASVLITVESDTTGAATMFLVSAEAEPHLARLVWQVPPDTTTSVQVVRREPSTAWLVIGAYAPDASGRLAVSDSSVTPGARYAYALIPPGATEPDPSTEAWLTIPGEESPPAVAGLDVGRPNPASEHTRIFYFLPRSGRVRLTVFDARGRRVASLADGWESSGDHVLDWYPRSIAGGGTATGLYFVRLEFEGTRTTRKLAFFR